MDQVQYVHRRKGRYMAQLLEEFEKSVEPLIPADVAGDFKALARRKMNALAVDCCELMELDEQAQNGYARDIKDRLHPDATPSRPVSAQER